VKLSTYRYFVIPLHHKPEPEEAGRRSSHSTARHAPVRGGWPNAGPEDRAHLGRCPYLLFHGRPHGDAGAVPRRGPGLMLPVPGHVPLRSHRR
jgi:hypothetical protein